MKQRMTRRAFATAGAAATLGLTTLETAGAAESPSPETAAPPSTSKNILEVRPYQLSCVVCPIGEGRNEDLGDTRLAEILAAVRKDPKVPIRVCLNTESVYGYQR